ncbi:MAG: hypothetical protein HZC54_10295 [Verrucomicrobia bacterium]|nr:hypothetical protein [Verrucomicrobiota bacterium]
MRVTIFFLCSFTVLAVADVVTTHIGLQRGGHELNPYTDTRSLWTLARPELVLAGAGATSVFLGVCLLRRGTLRDSVGSTREFYARFWSAPNLFGAMLVFVPVAIALTRIMPVASNLCMLAFGFSPWLEMTGYIARRFSISPFAAITLVQGILGGFLAVPFTELLRRVMTPDLSPNEAA